MNISIFSPISSIPRNRWTYANGSNAAAAIIYLFFTAINTVNDNTSIVAMNGIFVALYGITCMDIAVFYIIATVVFFYCCQWHCFCLNFNLIIEYQYQYQNQFL